MHGNQCSPRNDTRGAPLALSRAPSRGLSRARLLHDVVDDVLRAARPGKGPALAHGAGAVTQRCVYEAGDLVALAELIESRADVVQEGGNHLPGRHGSPLDDVDQISLHAVASGTPGGRLHQLRPDGCPGHPLEEIEVTGA